MTDFDAVIRGGTVVDGSGLAPFRADVGIRDGRIAHVGRIRPGSGRSIDADGHLVTPGFIDGHTHMDAQVFWDPFATSSSWHGVTTAVMGNCGFTLAPVKDDARHLVVRNLERAEDIPPAALKEGVEWKWEHFDGYLDAVEATPKAINYAAQVGHSALRTWAMGERAFDGECAPADLDVMRNELRRALDAGAIGFTTSRSGTHTTSDDRPVASRLASWSELLSLVSVLDEYPGDRLFELAVEQATADPDPEVRDEALARLRELASNTTAGVTFGVVGEAGSDRWKRLLRTIESVNEAGGRAFGQGLPRAMTILLSFQGRLPYDRLPEWSDLRSRPLAEQRRALADPDLRARLARIAEDGPYGSGGIMTREPDYEQLVVLDDPVGPNPTVAEVARRRGITPAAAIIALSVESDLKQFFSLTVGNHREEDVLAIMRHPQVISTFSDAGAHVGYILEASMQSYLLAYWVRHRQVLDWAEAVRMLTLAPATAWGFANRGMVRAGFVADLNVIDPDMVGPAEVEVADDLPGGVTRLVQRSRGIAATLVAGEITVDGGVHTGVTPGRLLRRNRP